MQITYELTPQQLPSLGDEHVLLLPLQRSSQRKAKGHLPAEDALRLVELLWRVSRYEGEEERRLENMECF